MPNITKSQIIAEAKKVAAFADHNLAKLDGLCNEKRMVQDYYLGMLRRQCLLLNDIATVLEYSVHDNFSGVQILCRCLLDDFINVFYLKLNPDENDNIIALNADVHRQMFVALEGIMASNHYHFKGKNPFYLTDNQFAALKDHFRSRPENDVLFSDKDRFRFKKYKTLTAIASGIADFELSKLSQRAFYYWKDTSEYVHYSNAAFEREINPDNRQYELNMMEEVILFSYNTIALSFRYFADIHAIELADEANLAERYRIDYGEN